MLQLLAHIHPSSFKLVWQPIFIWLLLHVEKYWRKSTYLCSTVLCTQLFLHVKKWWALAKGNTIHPTKIGLENWKLLGLWEKIIVLKWAIVSLKLNIFKKPGVTLSELQSVIIIFWVIRGKAVWTPKATRFGDKRFYSYTQKILHIFLWRDFIGKFL